VLKTGRPVLAVAQDKPVLEFEDAKSKFWKEKLQTASPLLIPSIKAIGRIELEHHAQLDWVGTGWLIDKSTVVTNRHVANEFGKRSAAKFVFRQGEEGRMNASIDFLEEIDRPTENTFRITGILHIEEEDGPDIAFLSAAPTGGNNLPQFISLSDAVPLNGQEVVVIGYPAEDSRIPDQDLMRRIFGNVYNKKRLAPGVTKGINRVIFCMIVRHLGGNSGSAVLDLKTGRAIGLHFAGRYLESNFAVPAATIKERLNNFHRRPPGAPAQGRRNEEPDKTGGDQAITTTTSSQDQQGVSSSGNVLDVTIPIHISVRVGNVSGNSQYKDGSSGTGTASVGTEEQEEFITEGNVADYADRKGYDVDFLGENVPLPKVKSAEKKKDILKFGDNESELKYCHFSVVMSKSRRQCFFQCGQYRW
jgi:endonuclease G